MLRIIRIADFAFQSVLILTAFLTITLRLSNWPSALLIVQFFLGSLQMTSSFFSVIFRGTLFRQKLLHFALAVVYLSLLALLENILPNLISWQLVLFLPSWTLGLFYYFLTFKRMQLKVSRGSFLPHLNF
jgi:hypothetical protein